MTRSAADEYQSEMPPAPRYHPTLLASTPDCLLTTYEKLESVMTPPVARVFLSGAPPAGPQWTEKRNYIQLDATLLGDQESPVSAVHLRAARDCITGEQQFDLFIIPEDGEKARLAKILPQDLYDPLGRTVHNHVPAHRQFLENKKLLKDGLQMNVRITDTDRFLDGIEAQRVLGSFLLRRIKSIKSLYHNGFLELAADQQKEKLKAIGIKPTPPEDIQTELLNRTTTSSLGI